MRLPLFDDLPGDTIHRLSASGYGRGFLTTSLRARLRKADFGDLGHLAQSSPDAITKVRKFGAIRVAAVRTYILEEIARWLPGARWAPLRLAAALIGLCGSDVAHAQSHTDQLNVYARALSTTTFAEQACPGFRTIAAKLAQMRAQARITDAEDATIADRIRESTAAITSTYERVGQGAWCADTYRLFGPDGTLVKGALAKKP